MADHLYNIHGSMMIVDPEESVHMRARIAERYEIGKVKFMKNSLSPKDLFVDIGACIGYFSFLASSLGASVYSFDPSRANISKIRSGAALNNYRKLKAYNVALGDKAEKITFFEGKGSGQGSKYKSKISNGQESTMEVVTLDSLKLKPTIMKIDAEGMEKEVLIGAEETIREHLPTLMIDLHPWLGVEEDEIEQMLIDFGYQTVQKIISPHHASNELFAMKDKSVPSSYPYSS